MKRNLESKVKRLEANVTQLQTKVNEQESLLLALKNELQVGVQSGKQQVAIHRTCHEARAANPSLPSGLYWIDPDGQGVGDDPINVFCDMTSGEGLTSVQHDTEKYTEVGNCGDPGCYSRNITYDATMRQMKSLAGLSTECHQSIRVSAVPYVYPQYNRNNNQLEEANSIKIVRLCRRATSVQQRQLFLVERQKRRTEIFLVEKQQPRPHLPMRNRKELSRI